ncbi:MULTISPECIES: ABC transporter permease [Paenibacillus]|uniref:Sugar ABC transporter permease n=1 Tax=Paenibacillus albilobatus TaxID=2716884 RepID=A0A920CAQ9_9BACL|nr:MULTISPECIES: ABC transporter permease [Paenibacillus]GIO29682.1 sugar ABC transporter permease [Paenibacillus albilobatus]
MRNSEAPARKAARHKIMWPLLALAMLYLFNLIVMPGFFKVDIIDGHLYGNLVDILNRGTPLIMMAIGMTLVIATEGIDISVGSVLAIAGSMAIFMLEDSPLWVAILTALGIGLLCGLWNGILVSILGIQPMVATLILLTVGRGIAQLITNGQILSTTNERFEYIGKGYLLGIPFAVYMAAAVFVLVYLLKTKTAFGLFLESTGANRKSSEFAGVKPRMIFMTAYAISGLLAAAAGIIYSSNLSSADANNAGLWYELDAILAVVIGGTSMRGGRFYLGGTVVGAIFIQSLTTTIYSLGVPPESILLVKAIVVIFVCLIQSDVFRRKLISIKRKVTAS